MSYPYPRFFSDVQLVKRRLEQALKAARAQRRPALPITKSASGSFVPFTITGGCSTDKPMQTNLNQRQDNMPKYVIERELPGAGKLSVEDLRAIAQKSCAVLQKLGTDIQWVQSYTTDDKIYCIYIARDEQLVREHAKLGGFPANRISEIRTIIDPTTAIAA